MHVKRLRTTESFNMHAKCINMPWKARANWPTAMTTFKKKSQIQQKQIDKFVIALKKMQNQSSMHSHRINNSIQQHNNNNTTRKANKHNQIQCHPKPAPHPGSTDKSQE